MLPISDGTYNPYGLYKKLDPKLSCIRHVKSQ